MGGVITLESDIYSFLARTVVQLRRRHLAYSPGFWKSESCLKSLRVYVCECQGPLYDLSRVKMSQGDQASQATHVDDGMNVAPCFVWNGCRYPRHQHHSPAVASSGLLALVSSFAGDGGGTQPSHCRKCCRLQRSRIWPQTIVF